MFIVIINSRYALTKMKFISKVILFEIIVSTQSVLYIQENCSRKGYQCCYNQYLNDRTKECTECPAGSIGWNCELSCPSGYYGRLCQSQCKCPVSNCHNATGCTGKEHGNIKMSSLQLPNEFTTRSREKGQDIITPKEPNGGTTPESIDMTDSIQRNFNKRKTQFSVT
ncbi:uncharacterized protein LOC134246652 [Saccostrea cucullata]|uniref:uncharacterized protein LOC134246652 n=1 Tax=Saccostrea cuccullata TaxID=36930 RepID=UPI002ED3FCE5